MRRGLILTCTGIAFVSCVLANVCVADLRDGLVAYYSLDGNAFDISGNANHGTICGGAAFTADRWGIPNGAVSFDGVDDYVLLPNENHFDLNPFSIVLTAKVPDYSRENWLIAKGPRYGNYSMLIEPESDPWGYGRIGWAMYLHEIPGIYTATTVSMGPVPVDEYFQLAITYDPALFRGYMDGSLRHEWTPEAASGPMPAPLWNDSPVTIGAGGYGGLSQFFLGDIDEIGIWNRPISESEIQEVMGAGFSGAPGTTPDNPLLPVVGGSGWEFGFDVEDPVAPVYVDPLVAIGYDYFVDSGPDFSSVLLPSVGDNLYDLWSWDDVLGSWTDSGVDITGGAQYGFGTGGVDRFRILGIEPSAELDPADVTAFVTGLWFTDTGSVTMRQVAIAANVPIPAPGALVLVSIGLAGLRIVRRKLT